MRAKKGSVRTHKRCSDPEGFVIESKLGSTAFVVASWVCLAYDSSPIALPKYNKEQEMSGFGVHFTLVRMASGVGVVRYAA